MDNRPGKKIRSLFFSASHRYRSKAQDLIEVMPQKAEVSSELSNHSKALKIDEETLEICKKYQLNPGNESVECRENTGVLTPKKIHLSYLDGMRGLAALYVILGHVFDYTNYNHENLSQGEMPLWARYLIEIFGYGNYAVIIFVVLSGYCLALPVALSSNHWFKGGIKRYIKRRALRILPPYYASLLFSLVLIICFPNAQTTKASWEICIPAFNLDVILSHIFLIHNLRLEWLYKINDPAWSLATEWQIYFILPVLIVIWKRFGLAVMVGTSIGAGIAIRLLIPQIYQAQPWLLGCFTLGVAGAILNFSNPKKNVENLLLARKNLIRIKWFSIFLTSAVLLVFVVLKLFLRPPYVEAMLVAAATTSIIMFFTQYLQLHQKDENAIFSKPFFLRFLESKAVVALGTFSYSFYLTHAPILHTIRLLTVEYKLTISSSLFVMFFAGLPMSIGISILFYRLFEVPVLKMREKAS
jgi:peptidoglycan/LPS O-acetylase OafA/YrhL